MPSSGVHLNTGIHVQHVNTGTDNPHCFHELFQLQHWGQSVPGLACWMCIPLFRWLSSAVLQRVRYDIHHELYFMICVLLSAIVSYYTEYTTMISKQTLSDKHFLSDNNTNSSYFKLQQSALYFKPLSVSWNCATIW